jgi:hypothetical protein
MKTENNKHFETDGVYIWFKLGMFDFSKSENNN